MGDFGGGGVVGHPPGGVRADHVSLHIQGGQAGHVAHQRAELHLPWAAGNFLAKGVLLPVHLHIAHAVGVGNEGCYFGQLHRFGEQDTLVPAIHMPVSGPVKPTLLPAEILFHAVVDLHVPRVPQPNGLFLFLAQTSHTSQIPVISSQCLCFSDHLFISSQLLDTSEKEAGNKPEHSFFP